MFSLVLSILGGPNKALVIQCKSCVSHSISKKKLAERAQIMLFDYIVRTKCRLKREFAGDHRCGEFCDSRGTTLRAPHIKCARQQLCANQNSAAILVD